MSENNNKKWAGKTVNSIFWGMILILAAAVLIMHGLGYHLGSGLTVWRILLGAVCLAWFIERLVELKIADAVIPLALLFLILEPMICSWMGRTDTKLLNDWIVIGAAVLVWAGLKAILPHRRKQASIHEPGNMTLYFDAADLSNATIHDNLGKVNAYIANKDAYPGNGQIQIHDNLGMVTLHIPSEWMAVVNAHDNLGRIVVPQRTEQICTGTVSIDVYDNLGTVEVVYD